jgi:integrase
VNAQSKDWQPASVRKMMEVLRAALKQAVANGLLQRNPCDGVTLPKAEQKEIEFLTPEEQDALLKALPDTDNGRALRFILLTGLRASELCGLRWSDVEEGHFTVQQGVVRTKAFDAAEGGGENPVDHRRPEIKGGYA